MDRCNKDTANYFPLRLGVESRSLEFQETKSLSENADMYTDYSCTLVESTASFALETPMHQIYYIE